MTETDHVMEIPPENVHMNEIILVSVPVKLVQLNQDIGARLSLQFYSLVLLSFYKPKNASFKTQKVISAVIPLTSATS